MFVAIIQLARKPNEWISFLERFYLIENKAIGPLNGALHRSLFQDTFHILPSQTHRMGLSAGLCADAAEKSHPAIVQGRSEIVNSIAGQQKDLDGNWIGRFEVNQHIVGAVTMIERHGVRVLGDKCLAARLQVDDIRAVFGPENLKPGLIE